MPACGRASMLFSTWMMVGAPDAPIRAGSPCDGTSMTVVNDNFQSASSGSCLRLTAVCGTDSWYWRLCPSLRPRMAPFPLLDQEIGLSYGLPVYEIRCLAPHMAHGEFDMGSTIGPYHRLQSA